MKTIHGSEEAKIHPRDWLTERADIQSRRDRWIPLRDFLLEIAVISLICWEIRLGYKQETQQAESLIKQQQILQNLNDSSKATADTSISLKQTTDLELAAMKESTSLSERSGKASETSAVTSAKALHISERAYLATTIVLSSPPKAGEKLHFIFTILNSGRTTAVEVETMAKAISVPKGTIEADAYKQAESGLMLSPITSKAILAAGQQTEQIIEGPSNSLTDQQVSAFAEDKVMLYAFVNVK